MLQNCAPRASPLRQILIRSHIPAYLCPNSCVIVCANVIPLSSLTLQLRSGWHMPATCATPKVLQMLLREQMSFLVTRIATSWWFGCESSPGFSSCCHLQKWYRVLSALSEMLSSFWDRNDEISNNRPVSDAWVARICDFARIYRGESIYGRYS